jgi:hypothetical protein
VTAAMVAETSRRQGWKLVYHSASYLASAISYFEDLPNDDGELKRPLTPDEKRFIQNERKLCALDFVHWATNFAKIVNWHKQPELFTPNVAQQIELAIWAEFEEAGRAIHVQNLKARRLGVSTLCELATQHAFQFIPYSNCVIASADPGKSVLMGEMINFSHEHQPWWLLPVTTKVSKGIPAEFGEIHTGLTIQAGNQFNGVARGATPNKIHLCVAPNTLVRVADGYLKPISEVRPDDQVITPSGTLARVKVSMVSPRRNELGIDVWVWGSFAPLSTTRDHKIRTSHGWTEAQHVHVGDFVRHPVRPISTEQVDFTVERWSSGRPYQRKLTVAKYPLSRDWGWLFGLFLAEGTLTWQSNPTNPRERVGGFVLSGDLKEVDLRTERIRRVLGNKHVGVRRSNSRTRVLAVADSGLARWIHEHFGERDTKHVPDWVWQAGRDFCLGIVEGYLHGDGHYTPTGHEVYASSVRVQLPIQIRDLVVSLGFGWSGIHYRPAGVFYQRNCREQWTLVIAGEAGKAIRSELRGEVGDLSMFGASGDLHWHYVDGGQSVDIEVEQIGDNFSPSFFDIEVDHPDHAFTTLQCVISNSELAEWVAAESLVDAALYRAIIDTPDVFCILESTAEGRGNWWHRTWEQNKRDWDRGRGRVRPVFLPWYVGTDLYPSETDLRARPIPSDWTPSDRSVRHAERARDYVRHSPLLMKYLAKGDTDWKLSPAQMWYHEIEYETALAKKELNIFMSELPADDIEAFQSEAVSVIDQEIILNYRERVREPWGVFTILGADIPQSLTVPRRQWDMSREPITIRTSGVLRLNEVFRLQPVLWDGNASGGDPAMKLFVWEPPEDGEVYGIGIDTGDGIGEDGTAMEGIRKGSPLHVPAQVFEFQSAYIKAFQLWPMALALGCWYSTFNTMAQRRVQCRVAIECKGNGEATQHEMQKRGWSNFHPWKRYDSRKRLPDGKTHKIGVFTSEWFRSQMMDYILTLIDEESLDVPSPWLVDEMASIERDPDQQKAEAAYGQHDDRFMAIAFILFSLYVDEIGKHRYNHRRPPSMDVEAHAPSLTGEEGGYAVWSPGAQAFEVGRPRLNTRI